jgi:hypothetical protein
MRGFPRIGGAAGAGEACRCYQQSHECAGSDSALGAYASSVSTTATSVSNSRS